MANPVFSNLLCDQSDDFAPCFGYGTTMHPTFPEGIFGHSRLLGSHGFKKPLVRFENVTHEP